MFWNKPRSAPAKQVLRTKEHGMLPAPTHLGDVIAAEPRIQVAATAGLPPEQPLVARLSALIEPATAAILDVLGDSETHRQAVSATSSPSSRRLVALPL